MTGIFACNISWRLYGLAYGIVTVTMSERAYLNGLNEAQRNAVLCTSGPLMVLAGAGSGKTRVITHRIVHLIHEGVAPHQILAVTFTNKAAKEMRERVEKLIHHYPPSNRAAIDSSPVVTTFHALGVRIIREFHSHLGLPKYFTIYDRADSLRAIKQGLDKANYDPKEFEPKKILGRISRLKGDGETVADFKNQTKSFPDQVAATVWEHYEEILKAEHALDFDDLLSKTLQLLKTNETVRTSLQKRYRYLHVDEYQDTNGVQLATAKLLCDEKRNICVVGDIDQNIYSWRGADIQNVLQFEKAFPGANTILLEENYRSTKTIIAASNDIIKKNRNRVEKNVFTSNEAGEEISLYVAMTGINEAEHIALTIQKLLTSGTKASDIAILYRTNFQSRLLEEACLNYQLPYQLLGTKFYERKEIKDTLSYLRLALNPASQADLARVINEPARGIGKVTLLKILSGERASLTGTTATKVERFEQIMSDIGDAVRTKSLPETIAFIMNRTGLETELKKEGTEDALSRLENLRELVTLAKRYEELGPEEGAVALIENAALQSDQDELKNEAEHDAVRLMTVHSAKGLEFATVFICGLEEGLFPHERLDDTGIDKEEERRLFYVALTRAGKKLYLSYAHLRTIYGSQRVNLPSSFLNDISPDLIKLENPTGGRSSGYETTIFLD